MKKVINEAKENWTVKDVLLLQKAHEKVLRATSNLQKAIKALDNMSSKNAGKPNGKMFTKDAGNMLKMFNKNVMPGSKFWAGWDEFRKGAEAAFPNNWKKTRN